MRKSLLSLSLAAALAATVPAAAWALTAQQAEQVMSGQQFAGVYDLQKKYGFWTAKATTAEGSRATVLVNDATGGLTAIRKGDVGTTLPSVDRVVQHLKASGFAYVSDVELSDGFWEAEVRTSLTSRDKVELVLHPTTLEVLSQVGRNGGTINGQPVLSADQMQMLGGRQGMGGQGGGQPGGYDDGGYGDQGGGGYEQQAPRRAAPAQRPAAPVQRPAPAPVAQAPRAASGFDDMDDDIPF